MKDNGETIIEVNNLVRRFGDRAVLDDISFNVHRGETLVIMGGSGCGKSTTAPAYDRLYETDFRFGETFW